MSDGLRTIVLPAASAGRDLPDRHHQRVVPRRDLADDPDRLAPHPGGVARHVLPRAQPVEHARGAGEEPQLVDAGRHLVGRGQVQRLAGVPGLDRDELVGTLLDRVGEPQQRELALGRGGAAPRRERLRRRAVRRVDVLRPATGARGRTPARWTGRPPTSCGRPRRAAATPPITLRSSRVWSVAWLTGALLTVGACRTLRRSASAREPWTAHSADRGARGRRNQKFTRPVTTDSLHLRPSGAPPSAGGHTQTSTGAPGTRRRLQGDRRTAPGGRPATVRRRSARRSGCPRRRCASASSASPTPA